MKKRPRSRQIAPLASAVGLALAAGAASAETPTEPPPLQARIAAVRAAIAARLKQDAPATNSWTLTQATNWTNWPKWSKWSNWANK